MTKLAHAAVDAAVAAGARYAEARVTRTIRQTFELKFTNGIVTSDWEQIAVGVRALIGGGWGFAASPYWSLDEAAALAREAVTQAKVNDAASQFPVDIGQYPVASGTWVTPGIDPFSVPVEEKFELLEYSFRLFDDIPRRWGRTRTSEINDVFLYRQERVLATSEGAVTSQTVYRSEGKARAALRSRAIHGTPPPLLGGLSGFELSGKGWERFSASTIERAFLLKLEALERAEAQGDTEGEKPVDVGRYDIVCDGATMASLVDATMGDATQLDRALGYEANAGGTSYLGPDPSELLGSLRLGSPEYTVTANRSMKGGLATVKWDDEGVETETATLVKDGIFSDYQTTREQAPWLASYYKKRGLPVRSHGYAGSASALGTPLQCTPNLVMVPSSDSVTFDDLIAQTKRGIAVIGAGASTDFQSRSGVCSGWRTFHEITDGKLGPVLLGAGMSFNSPEIWKNLIARGGNQSVHIVGRHGAKGEPEQKTLHSVSAPAGILKQMAVIDIMRKA